MVVTDLLLSGPNGVVAFLREYKAIECNCCNEVVGFRHRVTGAVICPSTACCQRGRSQPVVGSTSVRVPELRPPRKDINAAKEYLFGKPSQERIALLLKSADIPEGTDPESLAENFNIKYDSSLLGLIVHLPLGLSQTGKVYDMKGLYEAYVAIKDDNRLLYRAELSKEMERYVAEKGIAARMKYKVLPEEEQICVVKWCPWKELKENITRMKMTLHHKKAPPRFDEPCYQPMILEKTRVGKWFRGFFKAKVDGDNEQVGTDCSWFCLFDEGPTIAVPHKYVYYIDAQRLQAPIMTTPISIMLNGIDQFTDELHSRCVEILNGTTITFTTLVSGLHPIVALDNPSEEDILQKLSELEKKKVPEKREEMRNEIRMEKVEKMKKMKFKSPTERQMYLKKMEKEIEEACELKEKKDALDKELAPCLSTGDQHFVLIGAKDYLRLTIKAPSG